MKGKNVLNDHAVVETERLQPQDKKCDKDVDLKEAIVLAQMLDGSEYPFRMTNAQINKAKEKGLVVVFGASDDLMEFRGAIYDELGVGDEYTAFLDQKGLLQDRDNIEDDDELQDYFARKPNCSTIDALWNKEPHYSWTYRTDIPHATFEIV